jgi:hypothetical protein
MQATAQMLEGRKHLVVPVVMLTEGVHNGSNGPLFYSAAELRASARMWNGKPIVVYHPSMAHGMMAGNVEVFNAQRIGVLFNARVEGGALKADAWIDPGRAQAVDQRVLVAVRRGDMMEVSTGVFTDNDEQAGNWNGEPYVATARNYRPDHLAILPDLKGACSIEDGAGLCRNAAEEEPMLMPCLNFAADQEV